MEYTCSKGHRFNGSRHMKDDTQASIDADCAVCRNYPATGTKPLRIYTHRVENLFHDVFETRIDLAKVLSLQHQGKELHAKVLFQGGRGALEIPIFHPEQFLALAVAWEEFCAWADAQDD